MFPKFVEKFRCGRVRRDVAPRTQRTHQFPKLIQVRRATRFHGEATFQALPDLVPHRDAHFGEQLRLGFFQVEQQRRLHVRRRECQRRFDETVRQQPFAKSFRVVRQLGEQVKRAFPPQENFQLREQSFFRERIIVRHHRAKRDVSPFAQPPDGAQLHLRPANNFTVFRQHHAHDRPAERGADVAPERRLLVMSIRLHENEIIPCAVFGKIIPVDLESPATEHNGFCLGNFL